MEREKREEREVFSLCRLVGVTSEFQMKLGVDKSGNSFLRSN